MKENGEASTAAPRSTRDGRRPVAQALVTRDLPNGARLFVLENRFNPTVAISGSLFAGGLYAPVGRRLIASVTAGELAKGTRRHTKLEIAEMLESRGASLSFSADSSDPIGVDIGGAALSRDVEMLLDLLVELLTSPVFPEDELEKEKKRMVGAIRQQQDQTGARAYEAAMRRIYPLEHPFHRRRGEDRIASVEALTRQDLESFHADRYGAATLQLVLVGDVEAPRILDGLERRLSDFRPGPPRNIPPVAVPGFAPVTETVEMPEKASADVVLALPCDLRRTDAAFLPCTIANSVLGQSSLSSRLGVRVRDTEGLTYGIHSSFHAAHVAGPFAVTITVKPESREAAIASTLDEISKFLSTGMTDKEIAEEKSSRIGKFQVDLGSNSGLASAIDAAVYYGFGADYLDRFPSLVSAVGKEDADAEFRKRVHPDQFTVVSAGSFAART